MAQVDSVSNLVRALTTGVKPSRNSIQAVHAAFVGAVAANPPWPIRLDPKASDLEKRADHLRSLLCALSLYMTAVLDDTAQNALSGLDLRQIEALLSDLTSEVSGTLRRAADALAGRGL